MFVVPNRSQNSSYRWHCGGKVSLGPLTAAARSLFLWFSVSVPVCERTWTCLLQAFGRCLLARSVSNNAGQTAGRIGLHLSESGQSVWSCVSTAHTRTHSHLYQNTQPTFQGRHCSNLLNCVGEFPSSLILHPPTTLCPSVHSQLGSPIERSSIY